MSVAAPVRSRFYNTLTGTEPLLFHAQGYHDFKPVWPRIRAHVFGAPPRQIGQSDRVTVLTCNNGHDAMGLFEDSCAHLGVPVVVAGREFTEWSNAVHKPQAILNALADVRTPWVLHADSRDAILAGNPDRLVDDMARDFAGADMVFGGCQLSWPNAEDLSSFELGLPGSESSDYKHLNGGLWIARTDFARELFSAVLATEPHPAAPESEQGKLRKLFPNYYPRIVIDYGLRMFHNVGFTFVDTYDERSS
ncbi:hypothetical protein G5B39_14890 (plasmid) [Rhodobacteraceae bacterium SC52]|nr:hypothetical protein G5B39_14890 [Rhodobacteraceae bacterium SC52]